jgi:hypothetical protein
MTIFLVLALLVLLGSFFGFDSTDGDDWRRHTLGHRW